MDRDVNVTHVPSVEQVALGFMSRAAAVVVKVELVLVVEASKRLGDVGRNGERCPPQLRGQAIIFFPGEMLTDMEDFYSQFMRFLPHWHLLKTLVLSHASILDP